MASQRTEIAELERGIETKAQEVRDLKVERDAVSRENKTITDKLEVTQDQVIVVEKQRDYETEQKKLVEDQLASLKVITCVSGMLCRLVVTTIIDNVILPSLTLQDAYASLQEELLRTNVELEATKAVVTEQHATERALTDEAHVTKRALEDAVGDIAQIHAKRVRLEEEASHRMNETKAFEVTLTEATTGFLSKLTK